ncbi:tryptophan synthase alpha chain [Thermodesulfitimonas autotrophica]|uniref:Tryptophan synthase alpha chain n=1 Tax=Thermodesulfitimonas autotrophica TaxID=1894989 RepID=A0A3N5ADR7_9THEO|nr:tryptophan synthase subunit alpha [Thermodesulfitimonas autotrophica]RPF43016.1 tryptophan synthase alpha chain [Thermodesulfitimonas autotrophica]
MSRIAETFAGLRKRGEKGLVTYLTAGDPDLERTAALIAVMDQAGADIIEIGIPFSDPLADGPVIQAASNRALAAGVTVDRILAMVAEVRAAVAAPLVLMTYYNPVFQQGLEAFCRRAAESGVDGMIVPDLPYEESGPLLRAADRYGIDLIPLVAPTSTPSRIAAICARARGFIYCVSVTGVTGMRETIETDLRSLGDSIRQHTNLPVAIGFGVSGPEAAARVAPFCDAVVVGSAIVRLIGAGAFEEVGRFTAALKRALSPQGG